MNAKFLLLLIVFGYSYATSVKFTDCGSVAGTISSVDITPCSNPSNCGLKKGSTTTLSITFTPKGEATVVNASVIGVIQGQSVPFPIPNSNGCSSSGLLCPLKAGTSYTYTSSIPVLSIYPSIPLIVRWELLNQDKQDLACVLVPAYITS